MLVGHELLGHGRPIALGHSKKQQHIDAVQLENLIYRVMGIKIQIYGTEHWDGQKVQNYNAIPSYR